MADFKVDIDAFTVAINEYTDAMNEMIRIKDELTSRVEILRDKSWKSSAGDSFFKLYQSDWADNVDKYNDIIDFMNELLRQAQTAYKGLIEEANKLHY